MKQSTLCIFGLLVLFAVAGCGNKAAPPSINDPIITASGNAAQASAHIEAAESLNDQVKPHADDTGKALSDGITTQHSAAIAKLADTQVDLSKAETANQGLTKQLDDVEEERDSAKENLGYRVWTAITTAWRWFWRCFWLITIGGAVLHVVLLILGVAVTGPFGAIAMKLAKIVNPWTWGLWLAQHVRSKALTGG